MPDKKIIVIAEIEGEKLSSVTAEAIACGRELAGSGGGSGVVVCAILGAGVERFADESIHLGADRVLVADDAALGPFIEETHANVLAGIIRAESPNLVIAGATLRGKSLLPRLGVVLETGSIPDCTAIRPSDTTDGFDFIRPVYGGNKTAVVRAHNEDTVLCSIRPRSFAAAEPDTARTGEIIKVAVAPSDVTAGKEVTTVVVDEGGEIKLTDANFIIAGGRGMRGPEGFELLKKLAHSVGGAVGASRAAVDSGWVAYPHQVGQTGQTVQPSIYIACGISGQIQHLAGMRTSDYIIAINKDPDAPIMHVADIAMVGDLFEIVPELTRQFAKHKIQ